MDKQTLIVSAWALGLTVFAGGAYLANRDFDRLITEEDGTLRVADHFYRDFEAKLPSHLRIVSGDFDTARADTEQMIDIAVERAFEPAYAGIEAASRAHYTVVGQYAELAAYTGVMEGTLERVLFEESGFNTALETEMSGLAVAQGDRLGALNDTLKSRLQTDFKFDGAEIGLVSQSVDIAMDDLSDRYSAAGLTARAAGVVAGSIILRRVAQRIAAATFAKAGARTAGKAVGLGGGASAGAGIGLGCGPFAVVCSPVGAIIGGAVGWIATDKVIVEIDEVVNSEQFKTDLRIMLDEQKAELRGALITEANELFDTLEARHKRDMCGLATLSEFVLCTEAPVS